MGFALSLFVSAANRNVAPQSASDSDFRQEDRDVCDDLYLVLCGEPGTFPQLGRPRLDGETTLREAFRVLCEHYGGFGLQASICARVLAFYFLMERSAGAVLTGWVQPSPESPNLVILPAAVIHAIAEVKLNGSVLLRDSQFLDSVEQMASGSTPELRMP